MKILIAPDSFKDALPALEVCKAIEQGLKQAGPNMQTSLFPLADGGEGTASVLSYHLKAQPIEVEVHDPLFRKIRATYFLSADRRTAFIDMAEASGLQRLSMAERNPLLTTTFGTGELIKDALRRRANTILLGIGGSATNDAGLGMAIALGYRFLDEAGNELRGIGANLSKIYKIDRVHILPLLAQAKIKVLCDVTNPLYGPEGAAYIYGEQKGADKKEIAILEKGLCHFAKTALSELDKNTDHIKGAGAAGGLGAGAICFLDAELQPGIDLVMELTNFEAALRQSDVVITGEGRIDAQSLSGKLIGGICKKAAHYGIPVIALCGALEANADQIQSIGLRSAFCINPQTNSLEKAIRDTRQNLIGTASQIAGQLLLI